ARRTRWCGPGATWSDWRRACSAPSRPRPTAAPPARRFVPAPRDSGRQAWALRAARRGLRQAGRETRAWREDSATRRTQGDGNPTGAAPGHGHGVRYSGAMDRSHVPGTAAADPAAAADAFTLADGVLYLDCAAQAPRLRA